VKGIITRIILKIISNEQVEGVGVYGLELSEAEKRSVIGCSQPGKEISLSIKCGESS
jgi:hypothetical protein